LQFRAASGFSGVQMQQSVSIFGVYFQPTILALEESFYRSKNLPC
jgi:hypothetical protein